ncbi:DNA polymerase I [Thiomicrospira sp. R3]|uniref:DNA polymerase I n=1 Tax=Thiomicrospira sp. R3 TaxID=3035472 RepID=UPI00259BA90B|nr:DNA polymerase I [Thiomicrospira sp. R3]WFE69398.1 DNA polymerase I [Thiomicrospira sp. R3]
MSQTPTAPIILVDGSSYLFRAFHAMPPLTNAAGHPTGAIYGVTNMIGKLLETYQPEHMAVVFDAKGKTFRNELFPEYKAHRPPMPDELRVQIEPIHQIVKALGLPLLVIEGVEADDVIGTLAVQATQAQRDALISTGDKDMAQLVNAHITLINTMTDTLMTPDKVVEKFGIRPDQIIDYLALMGDSSDNIPGIPKCGPKTAVKWLDAYGNIDNLIAHADEIKGKIGETLREHIAHLALSRQLTTIRTDCDLPINLPDLVRREADIDALRRLFSEYEFKNWLKQLEQAQLPFSKQVNHHARPGANNPQKNRVKPAETPPYPKGTTGLAVKTLESADYQTILTQADFDLWLQKLTQAEHFAIDTETTSLDSMQAQLVGLSFALEQGGKIQAAYLPLRHDYEDAPSQLGFDATLAELKPLLESTKPQKVGQNLKYDWHVFHNHGIVLQGIAFDTMLESYVLNSVASRHNMDDLAEFYLQKTTIKFADLAGKGKNQKTFNQIELEQATPYAAEDADITLQLHHALHPKLTQQPGLVAVLNEIEMPLLPILAKMERHGMLIDKDLLKIQSAELAEKITALEEEAYRLAGQQFNLGSPKQLQEILFEKLGLPVIKKTPKGVPSTAEPVLAELAQQGHELPKVITQHRSLAKLKSTYTDALPKQINPQTGRVHTSYQQAVASTGRLSSTDPNLQNIPIRTAEGRRIRQAFIARPGYKLVAADYSQIELRIMAHLSQDAGLVAAFAQGKDIHQATAAEIFDMPLADVTTEQRRSAKAVNFGLIYGMSAFGLANQLGIDRGLAQAYIDRYFERYPGVKTYMNTTKADAQYYGYVETLAGRRFYLPDIKARGPRKQHAERTAINAPMQGSAADIIKKAMITLDQWIDQSGLDIRMLMQVHDELVFEVKTEQLKQLKPQIKRIMESAMTLNVPLIVEIGEGDNWDQAH